MMQRERIYAYASCPQFSPTLMLTMGKGSQGACFEKNKVIFPMITNTIDSCFCKGNILTKKNASGEALTRRGMKPQ